MAKAIRQIAANDTVQDYREIVQQFDAVFGIQKAVPFQAVAAAAVPAVHADAATLMRQNPGEAVRELIRELGDLKQDLSQHSDDVSLAAMRTTLTRIPGDDGGITRLKNDIQDLTQDLDHLLDSGSIARPLFATGEGGRSDIFADFNHFQVDFVGIFDPFSAAYAHPLLG